MKEYEKLMGMHESGEITETQFYRIIEKSIKRNNIPKVPSDRMKAAIRSKTIKGSEDYNLWIHYFRNYKYREMLHLKQAILNSL